MDMQQEWLEHYKLSKEAALEDLAEQVKQIKSYLCERYFFNRLVYLQLQAEFDSNQEKLKNEMLTQFKLEMESTKNDLDQKYTAKLQQEMHRLQEKHKTQISEAKKKQWVREE